MKVILTSDTHYGMDGKTHAKHVKFWRRVKKAVETEDVKFLIWAGDLAASKQRQVRRSMQMAREFISIPIVFVHGNHDWWDDCERESPGSGRRGFHQLLELHREWFKEFNIHHLEDGPMVFDDVMVCGWDGWYNMFPDTQDYERMFRDVEGCLAHVFMSNRAWKKFEEVLYLDTSKYRKVIAVTHHNPYCTDRTYEDRCANLKFYDLIKEFADVFCCGHNHREKNRLEDGCLVLNSGSDYNRPQFLVFEV